MCFHRWREKPAHVQTCQVPGNEIRDILRMGHSAYLPTFDAKPWFCNARPSLLLGWSVNISTETRNTVSDDNWGASTAGWTSHPLWYIVAFFWPTFSRLQPGTLSEKSSNSPQHQIFANLGVHCNIAWNTFEMQQGTLAAITNVSFFFGFVNTFM